MAASLRDLRHKIKSVAGIKKLTQAMQMVAASKMQKSIKSAESSRDYSLIAWQIIKNIRARTNINLHPLLSGRTIHNTAVILVTSNRGLCGGLNSQVIRKFATLIKFLKNNDINIKLITVGNKGKQFVSRYYKELFIADFLVQDKIIEYSDITPIAKMILDDYQNKKFDQVVILYNHFVSTLRQEPIQRQILPIPNLEEIEKYEIGKSNKNNKQNKNNNINLAENSINLNKTEYKFEPDINSILDTLLPTIIKIQIRQILSEANASEHSARMLAMKNATDNASDLIEDLHLTYNSLRQTAITKEISEISAGAEALKN